MKIDPFTVPLPRIFIEDDRTRLFFEYLNDFLFKMWVRQGAGKDLLQDLPTMIRFNAVSTSEKYTAKSYDFINAKNNAVITLPNDIEAVIIRNGDGSNIRIVPQSALINGEKDGYIRKLGTALYLQYFATDGEWFAR